MNLQSFFESFEAIAEAPGGVQKLQSLILDLAVREKLVPQDAKDESAEVLISSHGFPVWNEYVKNPSAIGAVHEDPPLVLLDNDRLAVGEVVRSALRLFGVKFARM
jgi:hypothetical protein